MKAAIYTRVSTDEQANAYGLDVQKERCEAQAIAKDWEVVSHFTDDGISGVKDENDRAGLKALLEAAQRGEFDVVIILALDRLGRKTSIVLDLVEQLKHHEVELVSCKESLDTTSPPGRFVLRMFASLAELERDNIVDRTTAGRNARGRIDGEKGGRLPMGYVRNPDGTISIDPDSTKVEIVQTIFSLRGEGESLRSIANKLNTDQCPTARRAKKWYASSVREVLLNEDAYRGGKRGESEVRWKKIL